jgi:hypothetical protein
MSDPHQAQRSTLTAATAAAGKSAMRADDRKTMPGTASLTPPYDPGDARILR